MPVIESQGITVAVLLCDTDAQHVGLLLHPSNANMQDPSRPKYHVGYGFRRPNGSLTYVRLVSLGKDWYNLQFNGQAVTAEWRDIYIADGPPPTRKDDRLSLVLPLNTLRPAPPFQVPHWLIGRFNTLGMEVRPPVLNSRPSVDGKPLRASLTFEDVHAKEAVRLLMGTCGGRDEEGKDRPVDVARPTHWARALPLYNANWNTKIDTNHSCAEDHLDTWEGMSKDFTLEGRTVRMSFRRSKLAPDITLVAHVELEGAVYTRLKEASGMEFPPPPKELVRKASEVLRHRTLTLEVPADNLESSPQPDEHITEAVLPISESPPAERSTSPTPTSDSVALSSSRTSLDPALAPPLSTVP